VPRSPGDVMLRHKEKLFMLTVLIMQVRGMRGKSINKKCMKGLKIPTRGKIIKKTNSNFVGKEEKMTKEGCISKKK
jgi:hypothetical protein